VTLDVIDLHNFYDSSLGLFVSDVISNEINKLCPSIKNKKTVILGYGVNFVYKWSSELKNNSGSLVNIMPEYQGVMHWSENSKNFSSISCLDKLPLQDETIDNIFIVHALEASKDPETVLQEIWRVLKPRGQLILIVPNRRGSWANCDKTPFGFGCPYSRTQMSNLLNEQGFSIERISRRLIAPPKKSKIALKIAKYLEIYGSFIFSRFGGILMIKATKQVYTPAYIKTRSTRKRLVLPITVPVNAVSTGRGHLAFGGKSCKL